MHLLRKGSDGTLTAFLQKGLQRAGFDPGGLDGRFGSNTDAAVRRFQNSRGLTADGIVGRRTWTALQPWLTGFVRYRIAGGDTLYGIARRYGTTIRPIETANPGLDLLNLPVGYTIIVPLRFDVVPTDIPMTSTVLEFCVNGLHARYPFLRRGSIGRSVMGRELWYLEMGVGGKEVFYNASHHGNEWITSTVLLKFTEEYGKSYSSNQKLFDEDAAELYNGTRLVCVPMVNPDGVDLVTGALRDGPYYARAAGYAAAYPAIPFPSGWKANIAGIDPNLQYPAGWQQAREIKTAQGFVSPAPRDFVGTAPLEIPESRAVYDLTRRRDFLLTLSYHTQGQVIYWKYGDKLPPESYEIGLELASVSGYSLDLTPPESAYAGYKDWFIQAYDRPGYTVEAGIGVSPLPLSQFDEIWRANVGILTRGLALTARKL